MSRLRRVPVVTVTYREGNWAIDVQHGSRRRELVAGWRGEAIAKLLRLQAECRPVFVFGPGAAGLDAEFRAAGGMLP